MAATLTGDDAKLVAAVVWETMITYNGQTRTAREWLGRAADVDLVWKYMLPAAENYGMDSAENRVDSSAIKIANTVLPSLAAIQEQLAALALVAGDPDAVLKAVSDAITAVVDSTVLQVRPT